MVENGFPLDFSYKFSKNINKSLRFALEPVAHLDLIFRLDKIYSRFLKILKINKMENFNDDFNKIFLILTKNNENKDINWFCHFGFEYKKSFMDVLKIYFAPFPPKILKEIEGQIEISNKETFMNKLVDCQIEAKERFIKLLKHYKMDKEISNFKKIYQILLDEDNLEDKVSFITFIGVDFKKGHDPSFKVYFNPNIRDD